MKKLFFLILFRTGLSRAFTFVHRRRVMILCYHSITRQPASAAKSSRDIHKLHLSDDVFAAQLDYLRRYYRVITLHEYVEAQREGRNLPARSIVLTFDDAFRNFLTVAAPLLSARSLPATVFIITDKADARRNINSSRTWRKSDDRVHLSWDEIEELSREPDFAFGSHSRSHPRLIQIPVEEARQELTQSYSSLATHLKTAVTDIQPALAYPHGETSSYLKDVAASLGYTCALTGRLGANERGADLYELSRVMIAADDDLPTFAARVAGITWRFHQLRAQTKKGARKLTGALQKTMQLVTGETALFRNRFLYRRRRLRPE